MTPVVVFDVNETLLDLQPVREWFQARFEDEPNASEWFGELLRLSFVSAAIDRYEPFGDLGAEALATVARKHHASIGDGDISHIRGVFTTLPAHADVVGGLQNLSDAGFTIAALTNSPQAVANTQLANAGLLQWFDRILSVEMVNRFKPHRSVYEAAANALDIAASDIVMVAAHDWDIAGALAAGCDGVFVGRRAMGYSPAFPQPTLSAPDITAAAAKIIAEYS